MLVETSLFGCEINDYNEIAGQPSQPMEVPHLAKPLPYFATKSANIDMVWTTQILAALGKYILLEVDEAFLESQLLFSFRVSPLCCI